MSAAPDLPHFQAHGKEMRWLLRFQQCSQTEGGSLMGTDSCEAPRRLKRPVSDKACHLHDQGLVQDKGPGVPDPGLAHRAGAQSRRSRLQHSEAKIHEDLVS